MKTLNSTYEISGLEAIEIRGGDSVEYGSDLIAICPIRLTGVIRVGPIFLGHDTFAPAGE